MADAQRSSPRKTATVERRSQATSSLSQGILKDVPAKRQDKTPEDYWAEVQAMFTNKKAKKEEVARKFGGCLSDSGITPDFVESFRDYLTRLKNKHGAKRDAFRDNILAVCEQKKIGRAHV